MKKSKITRSRGSVLLISLVMVTIILLSLASYLLLVSNESQSVYRSQEWDACVPVMEAGVEEAMTQIHQNGTTNLSANNWAMGVDGFYHKTRTISADGSWYTADIQPTNPPIIYSTAHVPAPLSTTNYVIRKVRVTTKLAGPTGGGLIAKGGINFKGGGSFDSYNSSIGYTPGVHGTNALAVSNAGTAGTISMGGGNIYGQAMTGPGGTVVASGNGAIGDTSWNATHTGIEPGWTSDDANVQFDDVAVPYTSGLTPTGGKYLGTNYTYLLNGNLNSPYYVNGSITLNNGQSMMIVGNVTLYVTAAFNSSGTAVIIIAPGGSLKLYAGASCMITGGGIINGGGKPANCAIYGLPSCGTVSYGGSAAFTGTVYAPEANLKLAGGSDCFGSFTANTITVTGNGSVHYDEALGAIKALVMASWNEVQP